MYEEDTDEPNGVLFEMPINDYSEYCEFKRKAKEKLAYYDTVVLIIDGQIWKNKIYRNDVFQYTEEGAFRNLHICLKDVVYSLDYDKLGISPIAVPIALRFGLTDGIIPTPSREEILYSKETITLIKKKIGEAADILVKKWNDGFSGVMRFRDAYAFIDPYYRSVSLDGNKSIELNYIKDYSSIPVEDVKVEGVEIMPPKFYKSNTYLLLKDLYVKAFWSHGVWKTKRLHYTNLQDHFVRKGTKTALVNQELRGHLRGYLQHVLAPGTYILGYKGGETLEWYKRNVIPTNTPKDQWRAIIKEWQTVEKQIIEDFCIDYSNVESEDDFIKWVEDYKQELKDNRIKNPSKYLSLNKQEGDVTIAFSRPSSREHVFEKKVYNIKELYKTPHLVIVFEANNLALAKKWAKVVKKEKIAIIGPREFNKIKHIKQFVTYKQFMEQDSKPFRRIATCILIEEALNKYNIAIGRGNEIVKNCLKPLSDLVVFLKDYKLKYSNYLATDVTLAIKEVANNHKLYDEEILPLIKQLEDATDKFAFLYYLQTPSYWEETKIKEINKLIAQMILFRKKYYNDFEEYQLVYTPKLEEQKEQVEEPAF